MVQINTGEIPEEVRRQTQLASTQGVVNTLSNQVVPVIEVGRHSKFCTIVRGTYAASGTVTLYTTPADKDFYLISATLSRCHIVTDNGTHTEMLLYPFDDGAQRILIHIAGVTLTVDNQSITIALSHPLKLKRNTAITCVDGGTYTQVGGSIVGFTVEEKN